MNEWTAINTFWNTFGIPAYDENTVPDDATMPYITYEAQVGEFGDKLTLVGSLWYRSTSWQAISIKAKEISDYIEGGVSVPYGHGRMWVTKGSPFAQRMADPSDVHIRRMLVQIRAEFH